MRIVGLGIPKQAFHYFVPGFSLPLIKPGDPPATPTPLRHVLLCFLLISSGLNGQQDTTHVLFVGNSLTYSHDMPGMVQAMLAEKGHAVRIHQSTVPGMSLKGHFTQMITALTDSTAFTRGKMAGELTGTENKLLERSWDIVILQTGTVEALIPESRNLSFSPAIGKARTYLKAPARIILFNTWASEGAYPRQYCQPGVRIDPSLTEDLYCSETISDRTGLTAAINSGYAEVAAQNGIEKSNNGDLFLAAREYHAAIDLFDDNVHPSEAGSFLNACEFYFLLTGEKASSLDFDGQIPARDASLLKLVVDRYHQDGTRIGKSPN